MLRVRVPQDVKEWLDKQSEINLRTKGAEIVIAVRERMEREEVERSDEK